jgi:hypothetical protein
LSAKVVQQKTKYYCILWCFEFPQLESEALVAYAPDRAELERICIARLAGVERLTAMLSEAFPMSRAFAGSLVERYYAGLHTQQHT